MNENTEIDISEYYQMPLSSLVLPDNYAKLIKRIMGLNGFNNSLGEKFIAETVEDILKLEPDEFAICQGIGKLYINTLIEFKKELTYLLDKKNQQSNFNFEEDIFTSIDNNYDFETPIYELALSPKYEKLIKRISVVATNVVTVQDIFNINLVDFAKLPTVGTLYVNSLIELKNKLPDILEAQSKKSALFKDNYSIEFNEIDNILIEDIENYLWTLNEMKMDIALSRWGFNHQHESLEEVGKRYTVTRERIRQLEKFINNNLLLNLTIQAKILWANIREKMTEDLTVLLPNLAKCFATEKLFYAFIELCCQVKSDSVRKIIYTEINPKIINSLFCINPSPISQETVINELMSNYGYSKASAINGIKQLGKLDRLEITEQGIYPKKLGRAEAVAHTLAFHPAGLPWKDIAKIVNKKGYSSTQIDETRSTHGFNDSEYVYLCGKGTFRNLIFLDIEQFDIYKIMQHLLEYFKKYQLTGLHLHDYFYQNKSQRSEIEYFTLRHLVREYGEEYGLYFNGRSGSDSLSINPDLKRITQANVIIKVLNESKVAMTKQEIAERLSACFKSLNNQFSSRPSLKFIIAM